MNTTKAIYVYLLDTLSDWEIAYLTPFIKNPRLQKNPNAYQLKTFTIDGKPICTAGGLNVTPDISINEVSIDGAAMLILPGGMTWDDGHEEALNLAKKFYKKGITVAGICGATLGLARTGLLDSVKHTSNSRDYLIASGYKGRELYLEENSVNDQGIITAPGTAPLEFARDVIQELDLFEPNVLQAWYNIYKVRQSDAFMELIQAVEG